MAPRIIPRVARGRLYFQVDDVLFPAFRQAATAWSAAEAHRLDIVEVSPWNDLLKLKQRPQSEDASTALPPLRRCDDCELNLGTGPGVTLRAAFACPRFGTPRVGVESRCAAFVAKVGAR